MTAPARTLRLRLETRLWAALALAASAAMTWGWAWNARHNDYGNEAMASFSALLHGHVVTFLQSAPAYGGSLLLRAPFALPASLAGGSALLVYRLAALPCLLAIGGLGVWLARDLRRAGGTMLACSAAVALCVVNPITYQVLRLGHPEELLGAALCVAAVLLAQRGRIGWAAIVLGLAVANKQWAILAVGPVVLAAPAHRWRLLLGAGVVASALVGPIVLSSATLASGTARVAVTSTGTIFNPWQVWWFFAAHGGLDPRIGLYIPPGFRLPPAWLGDRAHLFIVALAVPVTVVAALRRVRRQDALLLLALLMLLRCWLDPWDVVYYPLPFLAALLAWETTVARRPPLRAATATAATWMIFTHLPPYLSPDAQALSFLIPSTLVLAALAAAVYRVPLLPGARTGVPRLERTPVAP